jgi:phosphatidate cytidylyltransferase
MILKRWLTGLILGAIAFVAIWFGDPTFSVGLGIIAVIAAFEFFPLIGVSKKHPLTIMGTIGVILFIITAHFDINTYTAPLLTAVVVIPLIWLIIKSDIKNAITHWAWLLAGVLYIGWMLSLFIPLRNHVTPLGIHDGRDWTLLAIIACVASDSFAFHIGIRWGKHRLPSKISPSKTWEGTAAGFIGAIAATMILAATLPQLDVPVWQSAILGVLIGVFAPLGDLAESLLKRGAGVKDAGKWLPGHGGILDRIDSILFTVVVVYYFVIWVVK